MATFGLDNSYVAKFVKHFNVEYVREDSATDFFLIPQFEAIYRHCDVSLKSMVANKLKNGTYGPKTPIEMEIPKSARVLAKNISLIPPNYFRPGSTLYPEDRVVYHFLAQEALDYIEGSMDRSKVYSNKPLKEKGRGFVAAPLQWAELKKEFEKLIKTGKYKVVLKCDIAQYFSSINQHELINQLEHQGYPTELVRFSEKFLAGLTMDRSSRGIIQGIYASDVFGNGYLTSIDEFISDSHCPYFRYVDDTYILFESSEQFKSFFPKFVKKLRDYDLGLNESKTFITQPIKLLKEETELDKAIDAAKAEAKLKLTGFTEIEVDSGPYGGVSVEVFEIKPDEKEVELKATQEVFAALDDFSGEERHRAESFCLSFFKRAGDASAVKYVASRWLRNPDQAKEYALYLIRFASDETHCAVIDAMLVASADDMIDYQWAWAAFLMRSMKSVSTDLLTLAFAKFKDGSQHEVVRPR